MTDLKESDLRKDFITEWVAELRSGRLRQGTGQLRVAERRNNGTEVLYCCLGVACEVGIKYGVIERDMNDYRAVGEAEVEEILWNSATLPAGFWQWIGFDSPDPRPGDTLSLSALNDEAMYSFEQIADVIESAWLKEKVDA